MSDRFEGGNTKPDSQESNIVRSKNDKRNLEALRNEMTRHLRSYGLPYTQDSMIAGPSNLGKSADITSIGEISNDDASPLQFDPKDLELSPDTPHALFRIGRNPKPSALRVSDTSREILTLGNALFKHMYDPSGTPKLQVLDHHEICKLISNAAKIHDDALKDLDGGTGKADSTARGNARDELQNIANCLKDWQEYVWHMDESSHRRALLPGLAPNYSPSSAKR